MTVTVTAGALAPVSAPAQTGAAVPAGLTLYDRAGRRKYLTAAERQAFLAAAGRAERRARTLGLTLCHAGCRISEALALTRGRVDLEAGALIFESLKKRRAGVYRAVPVPPDLLDALDLVHGLRERQIRPGRGGEAAPAGEARLWPWSRATAWRRIAALMRSAEIEGPQATPRGLRHGFGVAAVEAGIPLNMIQKWLGHAQLSTTAIYADAVGAEEQALARRMWPSALDLAAAPRS